MKAKICLSGMVCVVFVLIVQFAAVAGELSIPTPPWGEMLKRVNLTIPDSQLPKDRWRGGGLYSLPIFNRIWDDWTLLQPEAVKLTRHLQKADSFTSLLLAGASELDVNPDITNPFPVPAIKPDATDTEKLVNAIIAIHADAGKPLNPQQVDALKVEAKKVPASVALAASKILTVVPLAGKIWDSSVNLPVEAQKRAAVKDAIVRFAEFYNLNTDVLNTLDKIDMPKLLYGAKILTCAIDEVCAKKDQLAGQQKFSFQWDTPYGQIALNGSDNDHYTQPHYLLIIDTGGDDIYDAPNVPAISPGSVSVVLDLAGNDQYKAADSSPWGAGVCGYGFLWDASGNDTYSCKCLGQGVGILGVGICMDLSGNDSYDVDSNGQGLACLGLGILDDCQGNDQYKCYQCSQGCGKTKGCAILLDRAGNDSYLANNTDIKYPSAQIATCNTSLSQGVGFGRRAHPGDGHSFGGGVGCLVDFAGDDEYSCGVFGQGCSYWYSLGIHVDLGGNDTRKGAWYVQGTAVHYSIAVMIDVAGDDKYIATEVQNMGHAKDHSIALLYDVQGNDTYQCSAGCMLGMAWYTSVALFWDNGGNDTYNLPDDSRMLAMADGGKCLALFAAGGNNTWTGAFKPTDQKRFIFQPLPNGKGQSLVAASK